METVTIKTIFNSIIYTHIYNVFMHVHMYTISYIEVCKLWNNCQVVLFKQSSTAVANQHQTPNTQPIPSNVPTDSTDRSFGTFLLNIADNLSATAIRYAQTPHLPDNAICVLQYGHDTGTRMTAINGCIHAFVIEH